MLRYENGGLTADSLLLKAPFPISSFGTDENGELYIVSYLGTAGIYRFAGAPLVGVRGDRQEPASFTLEQNFPNPFNPTTSISYHLPAGQAGVSAVSEVSLAVYDLLGREVATLVKGIQQPGVHTVQWNAAGASSGMYVCRLTATTGTRSVKMMLVR